MQLYFGSEWNEAGFSRLRLKSEEERKRLVGLLHSHALRCTSILACTLATTYTYIAWRGHRHTCRHVPCVPLAVWWTAVRRALCCARWEVGLLLGGFRPHRRTQHLTQTEGSCKLPFEATVSTHTELAVSSMMSCLLSSQQKDPSSAVTPPDQRL